MAVPFRGSPTVATRRNAVVLALTCDPIRSIFGSLHFRPNLKLGNEMSWCGTAGYGGETR